MQYINAFFYIFLIYMLWIFYNYVKKLPDRIHNELLKKFEFELNEKLEVIKLELNKELELLKITQKEIQTYKTKEFIEIFDFFNNLLIGGELDKEVMSNSQLKEKFESKMVDFGTKLYFFASDATVKKFIEWRCYINSVNSKNEPNNNNGIMLYSELATMIRLDLGNIETNCDADDFKTILIPTT